MSKKSAQLILHFLTHYQIRKTDFARLTGISRASVYKYLEGDPIHPKKAKQIAEAISKKYRVSVSYENLID